MYLNHLLELSSLQDKHLSCVVTWFSNHAKLGNREIGASVGGVGQSIKLLLNQTYLPDVTANELTT